jgi:hypothetical protein
MLKGVFFNTSFDGWLGKGESIKHVLYYKVCFRSASILFPMMLFHHILEERCWEKCTRTISEVADPGVIIIFLKSFVCKYSIARSDIRLVEKLRLLLKH